MVSLETLEKHIENKLERGAPEKEVLKLLVNAGWPEDVIQQYLAKHVTSQKQLISLKLEGVTKSFDQKLVLDRIDLLIPSGEILGVIGISGSGKSTLLHILVGFIEPDAGDVILTLQEQQPVSVIKHPEEIKTLIGFSTQKPSFYARLSVLENLKHFAALYGLRGVELIERCNTVIEFIGLNEYKDFVAQNLSGGFQKRLDIACSLLHNPKILILDEPTAELDPIAADELWKLVKNIHEKGTTIIIASHILEDLENVCTKIAVLRDKKIMETGSPDELRNIYSRQCEIIIETAHHNYGKLVKLLKTIKNVANETTKKNQLVLTTQNPEHIISRLPQLVEKCNDKITLLHVSKPTLQNIFETLLQKQK